MADAFDPLYLTFINAANSSLNASYSPSTATQTGQSMLSLLSDLDAVLAASGQAHFNLASWIAEARAWASPNTGIPSSVTNSSSTAQTASFYEYNARNQITLWGPTGEISDYASKQWVRQSRAKPFENICTDDGATRSVGRSHQLLLHPAVGALRGVHNEQQHCRQRRKYAAELEPVGV